MFNTIYVITINIKSSINFIVFDNFHEILKVYFNGKVFRRNIDTKKEREREREQKVIFYF
jgi:hypothetical protein